MSIILLYLKSEVKELKIYSKYKMLIYVKSRSEIFALNSFTQN